VGGGGTTESKTRLAVVTAGTAGLGRAIAERLAHDGHAVIATTRHPGPAQQAWAAAVAAATGRMVTVLRWDPADGSSDSAVVERAHASGGLNVLVNNAGPFDRHRRPLADVPPPLLLDLWQGNVAGGFRLTQRLLPWLRRTGDGRIINLGAVGAGQAAGWTGRGPYAAAKAALASLTRTWAAEELPHGVTANMLCPSDIKAGAKQRLAGGVSRPTGGDVAAAVAFLAGPGARFVTGQVLELSFGDRVGLLSGESSLPAFGRIPPTGSRVSFRTPDGTLDGVLVDVRTAGTDVEYEVEDAKGVRRWIGMGQIRRVRRDRPDA
jgi:3-oxoacyl-[acyl-carrier protein] reductase